jgi:hypothetical protein
MIQCLRDLGWRRRPAVAKAATVQLLSNVLLTLLWRKVDPMWNAGNLAFRA